MHKEALSEKGAKLFPHFVHFDNFYLAGGTALALQIGHRISVDFDFFSDKDIPGNLLDKVKEVFKSFEIRVSVHNVSELTVFIDDIRTTFLKYPFPVLEPLIDYDDVTLLGVKELGAAKAYTIGRRGSLKDYTDMYFILAGSHAKLDTIIDLAEKKYKGEFNARLFFEQLVYLEDIEETKLIFLRQSVDKIELERFFTEEIKKIRL